MLKVAGASNEWFLDAADWLLVKIMGDVNPANMDPELRKKLAELDRELAEGLLFFSFLSNILSYFRNKFS